MKITNIEFNEIVKGLYISEDNKGLLVEVFDLTGLDKNTDLSDVSVEVISKIENLVSEYADTIEGIVFDNRNYWELNFEDFVLDLESLCNMFPNLHTVACGGGEFSATDYPDDLRLMGGWDFCDLARSAYRKGNLENANYYYQWAEITDFYDCMHTCGIWLKEAGKYEEAEAHFKKIAGEKDKYGAVNNSYASLLDEIGRHSEAQEYLRYVLYRRTYEDAREFAEVFIYNQCQDENSPYWQNLCLEELNNRIRDYLEACDQNDKTPDIERILLNASNSDKNGCSADAKTKLMQIYGTGKYAFEYGEVVNVSGCPNLDKFKTLASETYESPIIRALYLDFIENWECERVGELSDDEIKALEAALLAIDLGQEMLFWLYFKGEYETAELGTIDIPQLIDQHKAADMIGNEDVWFSVMQYGDLFDDWEYDEKRMALLEAAYALHPENKYLACELLMYLAGINLDRFTGVLKTASRECVTALIEDHFEFLFDTLSDIKSADDLEKYALSLIEACSKFGFEEVYFLDVLKDEMLAIYQRGEGFEYADGEFPSLKNIEKATEFAKKYNLDLIDFHDEDEEDEE